MRTFGVEEELLLVDAGSYRPVAVAAQILGLPAAAPSGEPGPELVAELQQEMIESITSPVESADALCEQIRAGRARADAAARRYGARAAALATSPFPVDPHVTAGWRYEQMIERYGVTARRNLTCGFHVHVAVESPAEGVAVLDRIRIWLPVLLALSSNSPFASGEDTGYASYRFATWHQWPTAGPLPVLGSVENYREYERRLVSSGVLLDTGMLYFDARLSHAHPTVEVRIADVCATVEAATVLAALVRGMVETAAQEWSAGLPAPSVSTPELLLDSWHAGLHGVSGDLVHPEARRRTPAADAVAALAAWVRPALESTGDAALVTRGLALLLCEGTGADRQRAVLRREGDLTAVVADAAERTVAPAGPAPVAPALSL